MNRLFLTTTLLCTTIAVFAQYTATVNSNVNVDADVKQDVNINKNVNVSGYVHQTQTIIDYGAMALANAEQEKNRLAAQKYNDEQSRLRAMEIAANPLKAYDYGQVISYSYTKNKHKWLEKLGFSKASQWWVLPEAFFYVTSFNTIQNISEDGVTTSMNLRFPEYIKESTVEDIRQFIERLGKKPDSCTVTKNGDTIHNISFTKQMSTIWGKQGTRTTLHWETEGQIGITDNYFVATEYPGGILYCCKVRYYGDKSEITWEKLEGRRYYLKKLVDKVIATASLTDYKVVKEK